MALAKRAALTKIPGQNDRMDELALTEVSAPGRRGLCRLPARQRHTACRYQIDSYQRLTDKRWMPI